MILVDFSSTAVANIISQLNSMGNEFDENLIRHMILNSLLSYKKKFGQEYGDIVLCMDSGNAWRKDIFPYYKANRKANRENSAIDWAQLHAYMDLISEEIKNNMPYTIVKANRAEADDCIAALVHNAPVGEPIMIISNDKDFQQLQVYSNVKQYSPIKGVLYNCPKPELFLKEQIIRGDSGDGIPNILSDADTFVITGKRQKPIRQVNIDKWLYMAYEDFCSNEDNIERNTNTIDLSKIPENIVNTILDCFTNYKRNSRQLIYKYFMSKGLIKLMPDIQNF